MTQSFPLKWPDGWPRTPSPVDGKYRFSKPRRDGSFGRLLVSLADARNRLYGELERLRVSSVVVSSNFPLNTRNEIDSRARRPADQGVAIYFTRKGKPLVMAQDAFTEAESNLTSLALAIDAIRALERHGGGVMFDRAFDGFTSLPSPGAAPGYPEYAQDLGISFEDWQIATARGRDAQRLAIKAAFRSMAKVCHPDQATGSHAAMQRINDAYATAQREIQV